MLQPTLLAQLIIQDFFFFFFHRQGDLKSMEKTMLCGKYD